jgi:putative transposase
LRSASAFRCGARPPRSLIVDYVDEHKDQFGVEPICVALTSADVKIAPSSYCASKGRRLSARAVRDEQLAEITRVRRENYGVYGVCKVHAQLGREGITGHSGQRPVARCITRRLMKQLGLKRISRAKGPRTTVAGRGPDHRPDLVKRAFAAPAQDRLSVADIERHEALSNRAVMEGRRRQLVAAN